MPLCDTYILFDAYQGVGVSDMGHGLEPFPKHLAWQYFDQAALNVLDGHGKMPTFDSE